MFESCLDALHLFRRSIVADALTGGYGQAAEVAESSVSAIEGKAGNSLLRQYILYILCGSTIVCFSLNQKSWVQKMTSAQY